MTSPNVVAPPPWSLTGNGLVLVGHFPESFVRAHGFLADYQRAAYRGYVGAVMLVDYQTSGVGPYRELLFIPGLFSLGGHLTFSISKIYVSTYDSVWNGRENWGIPKELADFRIEQGGQVAHYAVGPAGAPFLEARVRTWGPSFPISTRLLPMFRVTQQRNAELLLTRPRASGLARLASLQHLRVDPAFFPDLNKGNLLAVLAVQNFSMTFPLPEYVT